MNKRTVLASLNKIANQLDIEGLHNEADTVTKVMSRLAYDFDEYNMEDYGICPDCGEYLEDGMCADCGYGEDEDMEDYDMGPEKEPFDFNSPEDEGDMYGDDMKGYMDKDTDF
jgi:ribosomal protein L37E